MVLDPYDYEFSGTFTARAATPAPRHYCHQSRFNETTRKMGSRDLEHRDKYFNLPWRQLMMCGGDPSVRFYEKRFKPPSPDRGTGRQDKQSQPQAFAHSFRLRPYSTSIVFTIEWSALSGLGNFPIVRSSEQVPSSLRSSGLVINISTAKCGIDPGNRGQT